MKINLIIEEIPQFLKNSLKNILNLLLAKSLTRPKRFLVTPPPSIEGLKKIKLFSVSNLNNCSLILTLNKSFLYKLQIF